MMAALYDTRETGPIEADRLTGIDPVRDLGEILWSNVYFTTPDRGDVLFRFSNGYVLEFALTEALQVTKEIENLMKDRPPE